MKRSIITMLFGAALLGVTPPGAYAKTKGGLAPISRPAGAGALAAANDGARRKPASENFVDAAQIYDYAPGAIFELYAAPEFLSTILLEEGETLQTSAAGDTARWMVEAVPSAGTKDSRTLIMVKPVKSGIHTNIVLVTDRRTYLIEAIAVSNSDKRQTYSAQIAWRYTGRSALSAAGARVPLDSLNFNYVIKIVHGGKPRWRPTRVFDDGMRTFIEFPDALPTTEAPPLFVIGGDGPELINYRVSNNRYVVDQLFERAELRLGDKHPVVVRIQRTQQKRASK